MIRRIHIAIAIPLSEIFISYGSARSDKEMVIHSDNNVTLFSQTDYNSELH